jgi:hypothetical protein
MPIFMPNDGKMIRGHMENTREIPPSRLRPFIFLPLLLPQCVLTGGNGCTPTVSTW